MTEDEFYGPERAAVLVIRIWRTDTGFTARVIRVRDLPDGEEAGEATADRDRLYAIVHQWLAELLGE